MQLNSNQLRSSMTNRHEAIRIKRECLYDLEQKKKELEEDIERDQNAEYLHYIADLKRTK